MRKDPVPELRIVSFVQVGAADADRGQPDVLLHSLELGLRILDFVIDTLQRGLELCGIATDLYGESLYSVCHGSASFPDRKIFLIDCFQQSNVLYYTQKSESEVCLMARAATRTANVFTRVDPETKEQAEAILNQLGIPMSNAIGMFLKQIVMQRGIPFDMKIPASVPVAIGSMTKEQFNMELQKGMDDIAAGRVISADAVEAEMRSLYGV